MRSKKTKSVRTYCVRRVRGLNALALEQEADRLESLALTLAEGVHELLELG